MDVRVWLEVDKHQIIYLLQVIQGIQIFHPADRKILETVTLWLVAVESLLLPHALWFFSRRYRHALTYVWQVYLLRRKDVEEEGMNRFYATNKGYNVGWFDFFNVPVNNFFSHFGTEPPLPVYLPVLWEPYLKCIAQ